MTNTLYIPGLGGKRSILLQRAWVRGLNVFRSPEEKISFFDPRWETDELYTDKYERLQHFYEQIGRPSSVWAISAGASLAVRLCVEISDDPSLHLVCGKIFGSEKIGQGYRNRAPAFTESVEQSERLAEQLSPASALCYVPKDDADGVIETVDMTLDGAQTVALPRLRHARAIGYALVRYLPRI
jgi:hypothetical protein